MRLIAAPLFILAVFFATIVNAQDVRIDWAGEHESENKVGDVIGVTDSLIYISAIGNDKEWLECYEKSTMKLRYSKNIHLNLITGITPTIERVMLVGDEVRIYATTYKSSLKLHRLYEIRVSTEYQISSSKPKLIWAKEVKSQDRGYFYVFNASDTTIEAGYTHSISKEGVFCSHVKRFDHELKEVFDKESKVSTEQGGEEGELVGAFFNEDHDFHCIMHWPESKNARGNYTLISSEGEDSEYMYLDIPKGRKIIDYNLTFREDGQIDFVAFYNHESEATGAPIEGLALRQLDWKNGVVMFKVDHEFDEELGGQYKLLRMLELEDGGYYLLTEYESIEYFETTVAADFRDVRVISISPEMEVDWVKTIYKKQFHVSQGFSGYMVSIAGESHMDYFSFNVFFKDNKLCLVFNDHPDNVEAGNSKDCKRLEGYKDAVSVKVLLDREGNITKEKIEMTGGQFVVKTRASRRLSEDQFLILGQNGKTSSVGFMTVSYMLQNDK